MALVTIELRNLLKTNNFDLWDFDLEVDDPVFEDRIKRSIENYFFFNEIGSETPDRFKHRFQSRLKLILPYYNKLYNITMLDYDPLVNYKIEEIFEEDGSEDLSGLTDSLSDNKVTGSETNQNDLTETDYPQHIQITNDIPSNKSQNKGTSSLTNKADSSFNETKNQNKTQQKKYSKIVEGLTGQSYTSLIKEYKDNIINIENMIINDLKSLFILIY